MERMSSDTKIMSDMEAWATVRKAIRNSNYHAREEFDLLPELVKSVVVTPENLIEWAKLDSKEVKNKVTKMELTVENEIRVNIQRVAEGHLDLYRKLNECVKLSSDVRAKQELQDVYITMHDMKLRALA